MEEARDLVPVATGMVWGLKRSLLGYLRRIPDGVISIDDGTRLTSNYELYFPLIDHASFDQGHGSGTLDFGGFVHLYGHLGAMDVTLARPSMRFDDEGASLWFDVDLKGERGATRLFEVAVTTASISDGVLSWTGLSPTLSAEGAELFQMNYSVGTLFDPISVRIPLTR